MALLWRVLAAVCAVALVVLAALCVARVIVGFQYDAAHPPAQPIEPGLAKSCLAGNDSACQAYPVAKDQDAREAGGLAGGQIFVGLLGTAISGFIAAWLGGEAIGRSLF